MYYFYRKAFRSGRMFIQDRDGETLVIKILSSKDNGKLVSFLDEDYVKARYPFWILTSEELETALNG